MDILNIDPRVLLIQALGFVLLLWLLKRFLFGPVGQMLESRRKEVADTYAAADREREAMEELRRDYEKRLAGIEAEARESMQVAVKEGQALRDDIVAAARERREALIQQGQDEIAREREKAVVALRAEVAGLVVEASSKLLAREVDGSAHTQLIDEFISELGAGK